MGYRMESERTDSVAVIAAESGDRQLMTHLLQNTGYKAGFFTNYESLKQESGAPRAMIFCHRRRATESVVGSPQLGLSELGLSKIGLSPQSDCQRVVVLSDCTAETSIVHALEQGAHHYFDIAESPTVLQARLGAALRQHALHTRRVLDVAPFKFNLERRSVYRDGKLISLSPKEYEFAYYLFANRHRVVVNSELMTSVWSLPSSMDARRIDTAACRVRKKMQLSESSSGWSLRRIRRVGYELLWRGEVQSLASNECDSQTGEKPAIEERVQIQTARVAESA